MMPVPSGKMEYESLVDVLEQKFARQEALIRELLQAPRLEPRLDAPRLVKEVVEVQDLDAPEPVSSKTVRSTRLGVRFMEERLEPDPPWKGFVKGPLDGYMGIVVLVNLAFMIHETQWVSASADAALDMGAEARWSVDETFFNVAEYAFFTTYLVDVLLRIAILGHEWYCDRREGFMFLNVFDACVVAVNAFELLILPLLVLGGDPDQVNSIRVIKLFRIARTLRIVKTVQLFRQLRLLVGTCIASIGALFWSMVLLMVVKVGFALIICQALQGVILDSGFNLETRIEVNRLYGSFLKALYTMFEITHSGSWPAVVRPIVERVNPWYAVLFLSYITLVVFAVIRIVTALFLKETLASTANDTDMVLEDQRRAAAEATRKLQELFHAADDDGDGILSPEEFFEALSLPSVRSFLKCMDVSVRETDPLFELLDDGDGRITITEFCKGLSQLKGQARALDMIVMQRELNKLDFKLQEIHRILEGNR